MGQEEIPELWRQPALLGILQLLLYRLFSSVLRDFIGAVRVVGNRHYLQ